MVIFMSENNYTILSVGGPIIIPKTGFDVEFLKKFRDLILEQVRLGKKFILVIGGGATARSYQETLKGCGVTQNEELDWMGIDATAINANFMRRLFGEAAYEKTVVKPTRMVKTDKPIIIAAGYKPGWSTDTDAVLWAKAYGAKEIFNLSNVDYVYDSDPNVNPSAQKFENLTWKRFRKIVGSKWVPGANVPFDPIAAKKAAKLGLKVGFVKGTSLPEVKLAITGQKFNGTVIDIDK